MRRRPYDDDPCRDCRYAYDTDWQDGCTIYTCKADVPDDEECDGEPGELCDYDLYKLENPYE